MAKETINGDIVIVKATRTVDLTTHLPKISTRLTLENSGKGAGVKAFLVAIDPSLADYLSFIGASVKQTGDEERKLPLSEVTVEGHKDVKFYLVELAKPLEAGKETTVDVETVYAHAMRPYPAQIMQSEKQFIKFTGNAYIYSPYQAQTQTTTVNCATSSIDSFTKERPSTQTDKSITYGPYDDVTPFKQVEIVVHYENNSPFLTVTEMTRLIEVSHWGNIAVEETYNVVHSGAVLKGSFSRYDYQRSQDGVSSVKSFKTILPVSAKDVYYRDEIGNISTSHLHESEDGVELELRPRFPLFGGWKTHYYIGYNIPSYQYLLSKGDNFALKMKFVDHIFDDQIVDRLTVKIILPEGSTNLKLSTPYPVKRDADELHYTYLDTVGRPVVTLHKDNLVENHIQDFTLHYTFHRYMLLQEPFLVVGTFYLLFVLVIIYVRLDFSISKDEASESRMRTASLIEQVQGLHDRRSALYQTYEDAINKFKASKEQPTFTANRKKIDADHKQLTQQVTGLQQQLKAEGSDAAEKIAELQKLDSSVRDQLQLAMQAVEKLIAGRLNKTLYVDQEAVIRSKREEFCLKMDSIVASL
jgi:oligosaccharyltransferase complex subunit alpha (ribophorin I)